jgi:hypothetical protein
MSKPEDGPTFEASVVQLLGGIVGLLEESVRAEAKKPAYMLDDSHFALAAGITELADLFVDLENRFGVDRAP